MTKKKRRAKAGRPPLPVGKRKGVHLALRVDGDMIARLDHQVEAEDAAKPGLNATRSMMVRILVNEALAAREKSKRK